MALFALGLLVVAPVVSRVLLSGNVSVATSAWCGSSHPPDHGDGGHGSPLDKCGYCGYLHNNPLVPGVAVCIVPADMPATDAVAASIPGAVEPFPHLAAHPRGPPLMVFGQPT